MVTTARITIRVFVTLLHCKESRKPPREGDSNEAQNVSCAVVVDVEVRIRK